MLKHEIMDLAIEFQELKDSQRQILQMLSEKQSANLKSNQIFTIEDLSKMFKVTVRTIYNWKDRGMLSFVQIGSKTYFTQSQLDEFLCSHQVKSFNVGRVKL